MESRAKPPSPPEESYVSSPVEPQVIRQEEDESQMSHISTFSEVPSTPEEKPPTGLFSDHYVSLYRLAKSKCQL